MSVMNATKEERALGLLSMAQRARRIVSGAFAVEKAVKEKQALLLIIATDASDESKKTYREAAELNRLPVIELLTREQLGACLGKEYRAVAALLDRGFAQRLLQIVSQS